MAFRLSLFLSFWALLSISTPCYADQQILGLDSNHIGVLRQFAARDSESIERLLRLATVNWFYPT